MATAMGLHATFNLVDMLIVGHLPEGTDALAALAVTDMLAVVAAIVCNGLANATVAMVSRRNGAGEFAELNRIAWGSVGAALALSALFAALGLGASGVLTRDLVGVRGPIQRMAERYLDVMMGGSFSILLLLQLTAIQRALGDGVGPAAVLVGANVLNIALDLVLVYGPGPAPAGFDLFVPVAAALHAPRLGVVGAAWATVLARTAGVVAAALLLLRRGDRLRFRPRLLVTRLDDLREFARIGGPAALQFLVRVVAILVFVSLVARHYTTPADGSVLAAFGICIRLDTVVLFSALGWGAAAATLTGEALGAGRPGRARRAVLLTSGMAAAGHVLVAVVYVVLAGWLTALFDAEPRVVAAATGYVRTVAPTYPLLAVAAVVASALAGAGATAAALGLDAAVLLGIVVPAAIVTVVVAHAPPQGLWVVIAAGNALTALAFIAWFRRGTWQRARA